MPNILLLQRRLAVRSLLALLALSCAPWFAAAQAPALPSRSRFT